ncbi:YqzE family protein [Bacillus thermotolerans]|uniref:YqzE family protein n=1 Tax=Bacillus thermotolerans TaxID=1221996 RepID=A0A0F5IBN8_BACTR|nr:YqzE family protein [Bacillus thermotolerans]KKB37271.1 hypothetical protein QY97_00436 [Bacillus thermotolerans]KKB42931.1 hypothetical protein QY95_03038 [Bacillus thermotolerans]KKB43837.1 hypothetical protein QY96_00432 [Bacillus thermotolerans]
MNEVVRDCIQALFRYLQEPKDIRRERRQRKKAERAPLAYTWFGVLPWALRQLFVRK